MSQSVSFSDFMARLDELGLFHMDLSLDRMRAFMERAGGAGFPVLHVVGTNGKGSTATVLANLLQAHGLKVGLSTSPHFISVRERIRVNGEMLSEDEWARIGTETLAMSEGLGLTYFELLTAFSVLAFRRAGVNVAVLEAGLGGRFDASNVFEPVLTVYTPIGMDHMNVLGETLGEIAADKAGAMRPGGLAVSAPQLAEAWRELRATAAVVGSELISGNDVLFYSRANGRVQPGPAGRGFVRPLTGLYLRHLLGQHQEDNARLALAAFHVWAKRLKLPVMQDACREALAQAFVPGRMQRVPAESGMPELILDGGHNPHGLTALKRSLEAEGIRPAAVLFGCMRDKPVAEMMPLVHSMTDGPVAAVGIPSCDRALPPVKLAEFIGLDTLQFSDIKVALEGIGPLTGPVLVCGSLYLLGEFYTLRPHLLQRPEQGGEQRPSQTEGQP